MDAIAFLKSACPGVEFSNDPGILASHGRDWTRFDEPAPSAVVFPENAGQVCRLVTAAAGAGVPLVPSGGAHRTERRSGRRPW